MDLMNGVLDKVKKDISTNSLRACDFAETINNVRGTEKIIPIPPLINLEGLINDIKTGMIKKMAEIN